jgi:hypothetical protein
VPDWTFIWRASRAVRGVAPQESLTPRRRNRFKSAWDRRVTFGLRPWSVTGQPVPEWTFIWQASRTTRGVAPQLLLAVPTAPRTCITPLAPRLLTSVRTVDARSAS